MGVCKRMITGLNEYIAGMEKKYNKSSTVFFNDIESGKTTDGKKDYSEWKGNFEALKNWEEKLSQYNDLYGSDKIDS
jgi:hypothetical protein